MIPVILSRKLTTSLPKVEAEKLCSEFSLWKEGLIGAGDFFGKDTLFSRPPEVVRMGIRKVHLETPAVEDLWNAKLKAGKNDPLKFTSDKILVYGALTDLEHAPYLLLTILEPGHDQMEDPEVMRSLGVFYESERQQVGKFFPARQWMAYGFPNIAD
ncbi:type II toxin-antitoxin system YafO family toxin [Pseudomonas syringae]|uniref:type II toxin-antitoxin system YafO family toxin n=1 Tax=Pseudomonas syringae TaxID=317 RepID=UPI0004637443|nr:type II toxin-antitoxin system YafO family toxin [Pseudomonas syringae]